MTSWARGKMVGFDLETTGVDVESDRAVTAALIIVEPDRPTETHVWLINSETKSSPEALAVHGITDEKAATGTPSARAFADIDELLREHWTPEVPLVAYNGSFDLTMTDREMRRHLGHGVELTDRHVVDPCVCSRQVDRYARGGHKLITVCKRYGMAEFDAHDAKADTMATLRVAFRIATRHPEIGEASLTALHGAQRHWHSAWALRTAAYFREEADKLERAHRAATAAGTAFVAAKFAALGIAEEPSDAAVAASARHTREIAADIAAGAPHWPLRPYVEETS